uniref:Uncharacterized protein n=1 Tax=Arion vulgaris TaxID=1028688 RepID=A0A0B6Y901_9EUPU
MQGSQDKQNNKSTRGLGINTAMKSRNSKASYRSHPHGRCMYFYAIHYDVVTSLD